MASIALIGPGRHGTAIAELFASHGVSVVIYHHNAAKAEAAAQKIRQAAVDAQVQVAADLASAVEGQEVVVLATLWDQPQRKVLAELGSRLAGKVLLDVSNPLDVTPAGIIPRSPAEDSAGQFVASLLPHGAGHAKAFSNLATAFIREGADREPPAILPFAADCAATASIIRPYLSATKWKPWLVGDISSSRDLEIGGKFNAVHGAYGRSQLNEEQMLEYAGPEWEHR